MNARVVISGCVFLGLVACQPGAKPAATSASASAAAPAISTDMQGLGTPEAFLAAIYANYATAASPFDTTIFTSLHEKASGIFDPDLAATMRDNDRLSAGYDYLVMIDPLCGCSGHDPITFDISMNAVTDTSAHAVVHLHQHGKFSVYNSTVNLDLVRVKGAWRIHDVEHYLRRNVMLAHDILSVAPDPSKPAPPGTSATLQVHSMLMGIYRHYAPTDDNAWFPTSEKSRASYFDPEMVALMKEDGKLSNGEVGALDADPFCGCQDTVNLKTAVTAAQLTPTRIVATVVLTDAVVPKDAVDKTANNASRMYFDFRLTDHGWRIHDIAEPGIPSLRQTFIDSNKSFRDNEVSASASS